MDRIRMAILTASSTGSPVRAPLWPQKKTFRELILLGRKMGTDVFVVSHRDFDWAHGSVYGYTLRNVNGHETWVRRRYDFPHVVYNRVPSRTAEDSPAIRRCLLRVGHRIGPRLFNPFYLNKATIFQILGRDPQLAAYLPATQTVHTWDDVVQMLQRYGRIYLKPARGSLGNYTIEVTIHRSHPGSPLYRYRYNLRKGRTRTGYARSLEGVRRVLSPLLSRRSYIAQQAIDLARYKGRPFDLRVLVQKDENGQWQFTGAAARVAGPGQITTHVPRGGQRASLESVLSSFPGPAAQDIQERLVSMSVQIAQALERALQRSFGEMSMDIGLDHRGRLWLFEANSKPLRFDETSIRKKAQERLLTYARALVQRELAASPPAPSIPERRPWPLWGPASTARAVRHRSSAPGLGVVRSG